MLASYLTATQNLLQNPGAPNPLYATSALTGYINTARGQLAGESACIRAMGSVALSAGVQGYPFSSFTLPNSTTSGIAGAFNVRTVWLVTGASGLTWMTPETFEEFSVYELNSATPATGLPNLWAQYSQGAAGSIYVSPLPTAAGALQVDCTCYPIALADDTTVEAIPYLWTDAVPYFAAYLALLSSQTGARSAEADKMMQRYSEFSERARRASTPAILPWQFEQTAVPGGLNASASAKGAG